MYQCDICLFVLPPNPLSTWTKVLFIQYLQYPTISTLSCIIYNILQCLRYIAPGSMRASYNVYNILLNLQYPAISTISCAWINASFVICLQYPAKSTISRNIYNILRLDRCELHTISSNEFSPEQMHHEDFGTVLDLRNFLHDLYFFIFTQP